jgi:hypothetical protein
LEGGFLQSFNNSTNLLHMTKIPTRQLVPKPLPGKARPPARPTLKDPAAAGLARRELIIQSAERAGLLAGDSARIAGRIRQALVKAAKARSGITSDTELLEYALARVALEDRFSETLTTLRGTVSSSLDLEF